MSQEPQNRMLTALTILLGEVETIIGENEPNSMTFTVKRISGGYSTNALIGDLGIVSLVPDHVVDEVLGRFNEEILSQEEKPELN